MSTEVACDACDGQGIILTRHRLWGSISCPDPYDETPCTCCGGTGAWSQ